MYAKLEKIVDPYAQDLFGETCLLSNGIRYWVGYLDSEDGWLDDDGAKFMEPTHFLKIDTGSSL